MDKLSFSPLDITDTELNNKPEELSIEDILNNDEDTESSLNNSKVSEDFDTLEFQSFNSFTETEETLDNQSVPAQESEVECTALVELKPHGLLVAQTMFKKSIRISIKSFLISLSLGFLNLFI